MSVVTERLTAEAYLARDDPRRTELVDGTVIVNEPGILHQHVCLQILEVLVRWRRTPEGRGTVSLPLNVPLGEHTVLAPDVLWFEQELPLSAVNAPRAPELAVEVRSPATWRLDVGRKRELYERHGVDELWLADPASRTMLVYRRSGSAAGFDVSVEIGPGETLRSPLLPGFGVAVGELIPAV